MTIDAPFSPTPFFSLPHADSFPPLRDNDSFLRNTLYLVPHLCSGLLLNLFILLSPPGPLLSYIQLIALLSLQSSFFDSYITFCIACIGENTWPSGVMTHKLMCLVAL